MSLQANQSFKHEHALDMVQEAILDPVVRNNDQGIVLVEFVMNSPIIAS